MGKSQKRAHKRQKVPGPWIPSSQSRPGLAEVEVETARRDLHIARASVVFSPMCDLRRRKLCPAQPGRIATGGNLVAQAQGKYQKERDPGVWVLESIFENCSLQHWDHWPLGVVEVFILLGLK